jgi:hypothetical protein
MKRTINKLECKICNNMYSSAGFGNHLKSTHHINIDDYIKQFGEYRVNKIKNNSRNLSKIKCLIDNQEYTGRELSYSLKKKYNLTKQEYIIKYILKDEIPKCKCGCGLPVKIKSYTYPYHSEYISGHNSHGNNNPMFNKTHNIISKNKMSESAKIRCKKIKDSGKTLEYHSSESIIKRSEKYSNTMLLRRVKNNNVTLISSNEELKNKKYKYICNKCNTIYEETIYPQFICEICFPKIRSRYEKELSDILANWNIIYKQNCRKELDNRYELDIYVPELKLGIEFNGLYYHSENSGNKNKFYHLNKLEYCNSKGINLIQIYEDEWLFKKEIVLSKLRNKLNLLSNKVYARKCELKEISFKEKSLFLNKNHIQGDDKSKIRIGAFYKNELISVMTFSKPSISKGNKNKNQFELSRFCSKLNYNCIGIFSKMLKYFIKTYNPNCIITYADKRYSGLNNVYEKNGFKLQHHTPANYWYMDKKYLKRYHRFNFRKSVIINKMGGNKDLTEWENMKDNGYDRIWDCGNLKYIMKCFY